MQESTTPVEATISETTVLALPRSVVSFYVPSKAKTVLVADKSGNWLVVDAYQQTLYDNLASGRTVGEVLQSTDESDRSSLFSLLAQIFARDFFSKEDESVSSPTVSDSAFLYLTYACNLRCSHCYMFRARNHEAPLTLDEYKKLFKDLAAQGVKSITFSGGEPLLHPLFRELVLAAKEYLFNVTVLSNGTKWDESFLSFSKGNIDEVQISVDGIDEVTCSRVRGPGVFEKAVSTAISLAKIGVVTSVATTPIATTVQEIDKGYLAFAKRLQEQSADKIIFRLSSKLLDGRDCGHSEEFASLASKLANQLYRDNKSRTFSINHPPNVGLRTCGWGSLAFSPDGFAYPCNRVDDCATLGSIRRVSVGKLFQNASTISRASDVDHTEPCRKCSLRYLCGGGCRLDDFMTLSEDLTNPSVRKSCSEEMKLRLLETMIETTSYLYSFER